MATNSNVEINEIVLGPNSPPGSKLCQQTLPSCNPQLTSRFAIILFFCCGLVFLGLGVMILVESTKLRSSKIPYGHCVGANRTKMCYSQNCNCQLNFTLSEDMPGPVFLYYQLTNFHQNYRTFMQSVNYAQLLGRYIPQNKLEKCEPLVKNEFGLTYLPCGIMANSIFNDTFKIYYLSYSSRTYVEKPLTDDHDEFSDEFDKIVVPFEARNIIPYAIKTRKYGRLSAEAVVNTSKPLHWTQTAVQRDSKAFTEDESLMVWMEPSSLSSFLKLAGVLNFTSEPFKNGLPKGLYTIDVNYNFPVDSYGDKLIVVTNTNFMGGQNFMLGYLFLVSGIIEIFMGMMICIVTKRQMIIKASSNELLPKPKIRSTLVRNSNFKSIYMSKEERNTLFRKFDQESFTESKFHEYVHKLHDIQNRNEILASEALSIIN